MCQTNSSLPLPHTSWPWTPPSPCLLRCAFLSITLSCVGAGSPSLGGAGGSGPPWLLTLSPFLLLWIPAAVRWQRLLGLHCYGGGGRGGLGEAEHRGGPLGGCDGACVCWCLGDRGRDAALPGPACCWVAFWQRGDSAMRGVRAVPSGGGGDPCAALGESLGLCPPPSRVQPPSRVCPVL